MGQQEATLPAAACRQHWQGGAVCCVLPAHSGWALPSPLLPPSSCCRSDLASVFVQLFDDDALAFACFERLMRGARRNFRHDETGIRWAGGRCSGAGALWRAPGMRAGGLASLALPHEDPRRTQGARSEGHSRPALPAHTKPARLLPPAGTSCSRWRACCPTPTPPSSTSCASWGQRTACSRTGAGLGWAGLRHAVVRRAGVCCGVLWCTSWNPGLHGTLCRAVLCRAVLCLAVCRTCTASRCAVSSTISVPCPSSAPAGWWW